MSRLAVTVALLTALVTQTLADACKQDDEGLENDLRNNIVTENARTSQDHINGILNHFFTSNEGVFEWFGLRASIGVGELVKAYAMPWGSVDFPVVTCNEIGQCAQGSVTGFYRPLPSEAATDLTNGVLGFFSIGTLSFEKIHTPHFVDYRIAVTMPDGSSSAIEKSGAELNQISTERNLFDIDSANTPAANDKRCRDNEGNLTETDEGIPFGDTGSGGETNTPVVASTGYYIKVQIGWDCEPTETGVVCRRVYERIWVESAIWGI